MPKPEVHVSKMPIGYHLDIAANSVLRSTITNVDGTPKYTDLNEAHERRVWNFLNKVLRQGMW